MAAAKAKADEEARLIAEAEAQAQAEAEAAAKVAEAARLQAEADAKAKKEAEELAKTANWSAQRVGDEIKLTGYVPSKAAEEQAEEAEQAKVLLEKAEIALGEAQIAKADAEELVKNAKTPDDTKSAKGTLAQAKKAIAQANKSIKQADALLEQSAEDTKIIKLEVGPETWYDIDLDKLDPDTPVLHVFHEDLANKPDVFNNTTTNFGHHNLGVQFRPYEVIPAMVSSGDTVTKHFANIIAREPDRTTLYFSKEQLPITRAPEHTQHKIGIISDSETNNGLSIMGQIEEAYIALFDGNFPGDLAMPGFNLQSVGALNTDRDTSEEMRAITLTAKAIQLIEDGCTIITAETEVSTKVGDMLEMLCLNHGAYYIHADGVDQSKKLQSDAGDNKPQRFAENIAKIVKNFPKINPVANSFSPVFQNTVQTAVLESLRPLLQKSDADLRANLFQHEKEGIRPTNQKIGIMTGNASSSGRLLLGKIKSHVSKLVSNVGDSKMTMPDFVLRSQPKFGLSMEMNANAHDIADILRGEAQKLIDDGCTVITLACNTMDVFGDMLQAMCQKAGVQFVPIHSLVKNQLTEMGVTDVSILGAAPVASLERWSTYADLGLDHTVHQTPEIDEIGYAVKNRQSAERQIEAVQKVFERVTFGDLGGGKKPAVIAALTELSEVFNKNPGMLEGLGVSKGGVAIIDAMDLHAGEIARIALEAPEAGTVEPDTRDELDKAIQFPEALRMEKLQKFVA